MFLIAIKGENIIPLCWFHLLVPGFSHTDSYYLSTPMMQTSKRKMIDSVESSPRLPPTNKRTAHTAVDHNFEHVIEELRKITNVYQKTCTSVIKILKVDPRTKFKQHFFVAAVPDLMNRIHYSLDFSNRVVFLSSVGNANRFNCRVFVLMVDSHVGALPMGFFLTSNKSPNMMEPMFRALNEILPQNAFNTPPCLRVVITGIEPGEHTSMSKSFSSTKAYIGTFHLLRDMWKFLWHPENNIELNDRTTLFNLFEDILRSPSEEAFEENINLYIENEVFGKYPKFPKYFSNLLKKKESWGLDFRIREHVPYDQNILVSERHVLKEDILHKCRGCGVTELFEFLCTVFCDYYQQKLLDSANGTINRLNELRYMPRSEQEENNLKVVAVYSDEVMVVHTVLKSEFCVNKELGTCSCVLGKEGSPCIHQYVVAKKFNSYLFEIAPMSADQKCQYKYLAVGRERHAEKILVNSAETNNWKSEDVGTFDDLTEYVIVSDMCEEEDTKEVSMHNSVERCSPAVEDVCVQEVKPKCLTENCVQTIGPKHSVEDCVQAIETFWSKLSQYVDDHTDQIYDWISVMNEKLGRANSFDDVLSTLYADSKM